VRAIDAALERFLPHYLHLLSIPSEQYPMPAQLQGAERRRAFEEALAAIFTLAARRRPLVVVLEDWHWVDATSDAVLKHLVGLVDQYPLMVVMLCRPGYDLSWAAPARFTRVVLAPLSIAETGSMACTALKVAAMPDALQALLHERTGGNPLFIEEVCSPRQS
jgi:predicted ATPase